MEDKKEPYYLVSTDWKKKAENIIKESRDSGLRRSTEGINL